MGILLEVDDVTVSFGGVQALDHVSLAVPAGAIVGLIGSNGAGKTTLFDVITGLRRPDTGAVIFDGQDISKLPTHKRARLGIGRSFQNLGLNMQESALANVLGAQYLSRAYSMSDVALRPWKWWAGERVLHHRARDAIGRFGLADDLDRPVADLSFAAARFVELAAVLVEQPRMMLLDEPTTGLDRSETAVLNGVLRDVQSNGTTILVVAHDVSFTMKLCDHVYVLAGGVLLCDGPPRIVQRDPAVIEAYLGTQHV